ncbi:MAG: hypothetical protein WC523_04320 [Patescibacteria group bacterium]
MKYLIAFFVIFTASCMSGGLHSVRPLTISERGLVYLIVRRAEKSDNKDYYLDRLQALLDTAEATSEEIKNLIVSNTDVGLDKAKKETLLGAKKAGLSVEEYTSIEERRESRSIGQWSKIKAEHFDKYFYISRDDVNNIFIHIRIYLYGDNIQISKVLLLEDNMEKHLSIPGSSFNIKFVDKKDADVFEIKIDPTEWPSSVNWAGVDYQTCAHEVLHNLGIGDEYDYIEQHAINKYLSIEVRLSLFLYQMGIVLPKDADKGIMSSQYNRPLDRHICAVVRLDNKCIESRLKH